MPDGASRKALSTVFLPELNSRRAALPALLASQNQGTPRQPGPPQGSRMPGSGTLVFSEPEDFEAALHAEGCLGLWITGRGRFQARLTRVALHRLRLSTAEEQLSRIAFIAVPADMVMMSFPIGTGTGPVYGGIGTRSGEFTTIGPGQHVHARTDGPCRWGAIWLPVKELVQYGRRADRSPVRRSALHTMLATAASGWQGSAPPPCDRHPDGRNSPASTCRRRSRARAGAAIDPCRGRMPVGRIFGSRVPQPPVGTRTRWWDLSVCSRLSRTEICGRRKFCAALGVSDRLLRSVCAEHLGMGPTGYDRLRRMSLVRRTLRHANADVARVSEVARRYGFRRSRPLCRRISRGVRRVALRNAAAGFRVGRLRVSGRPRTREANDPSATPSTPIDVAEAKFRYPHHTYGFANT